MGSGRPRRRRRVATGARAAPASHRLPAALRRLFWDLDAKRLTWDRDRDLVVGRVLAQGGWNEARVLRRKLGDAALREWVLRHDARGLSAPRLRFWELVLDLPKAKADAWVRSARATVWEDRHPR